MFAKDKLFAQTSLDDNEILLYKKLATIFEKNITYPDLVIFLQSDVDRLMENIRKRARDYETDIEWEYLSQLNEIYNQYFFSYDKSNLLVINTNDIDFVNDKQDLDQILQVIKTPFSGTKFFNPIKKSVQVSMFYKIIIILSLIYGIIKMYEYYKKKSILNNKAKPDKISSIKKENIKDAEFEEIE